MRIFLSILIGVFIFIFGVLTDHYWGSLKFDDSINGLDLATLIITIILAVYIPMVLSKKMDVKKYEKDVIIKKLEQLQLPVQSINTVFNECFIKNNVSIINTHLILNNFTVISNQIKSIETLSKYCKYYSILSDLEELNKLRHNYKKIITGGRFQSRNFKFPASTKSQNDITFYNFDEKICVLIIKINSL